MMISSPTEVAVGSTLKSVAMLDVVPDLQLASALRFAPPSFCQEPIQSTTSTSQDTVTALGLTLEYKLALGLALAFVH